MNEESDSLFLTILYMVLFYFIFKRIYFGY